MPDVCSICGAPLGKTSKLSPSPYCRGCRRDRGRMANTIGTTVFLAFALLMSLGASREVRLAIYAFLAYIVIALYLELAFHESAHALAAIALGHRIQEIRIGGSASIAALRIGGVSLGLGWPPSSGLTLCAAKSSRALRIRSILVRLAGPAANLAVAYALGFKWSWFSSLPGLSFLQILALINAVRGFLNLLPFVGYVPSAGMNPTDGLAVLMLLGAKAGQFGMAPAAYYSMRTGQALERRLFDEAAAWIERGLAMLPDNPLNLTGRAVLLLELERTEEARTIFKELLGREDLDPAAKPYCLNNLAWADLLCGDRDLLAEADESSAQAMGGAARPPHFYGTRGAVLVLTGRPEQALILLRQAYRRQTGRGNKATNLYFMARAEAILGRADEAANRLERARRLDVREVERLERCLPKGNDIEPTNA